LTQHERYFETTSRCCYQNNKRSPNLYDTRITQLHTELGEEILKTLELQNNDSKVNENIIEILKERLY